MPTYKFKDKNTKKTWTEFMGISEAETYLLDNPHIERLVHGAPMITRFGGNQKPDSGFRDRLKEIKKKHRRSNINTF